MILEILVCAKAVSFVPCVWWQSLNGKGNKLLCVYNESNITRSFLSVN